MTLFCDLTEFVTNPIRTGIQRVTYEIITRWTGRSPLVPVCLLESGAFLRLPSECFELMKSFFRLQDADELNQIQARIQNLIHHPKADRLQSLPAGNALFTPEVFFCPRRIGRYREIATSGHIDVFLTIHDFLPWIQPEFFQENMSLATFPYFRLLREIPHLAFTTDWSRNLAEERIFRGRRRAGVTIPLGCDGLGTAPPNFDSHHQSFSVISTIEPRKGHLLVLDAFESLWRKGHAVPLSFVGRPGWLSEAQLARIDRLQNEQALFSWHSRLTDPQVRDVILNSRATIYMSQHEGFGLPPVESLALGKPVIVSAHIPSVQMIPPHGQVRLSKPTPESLEAAILTLTDDNQARAKTEEIRSLDLSTWDACSKGYSDWIESALESRRRWTDAA